MPAEWEPHASTWIAWPHNPKDWPGRFAPIPFVYADIVRHLSAHERVNILANDAAHRAKAVKVLSDCQVSLKNVQFHLWPTNRVWTRDSGAIFVVDRQRKKLGATCWRFNAWAKYDDWQLDTKISEKMAKQTGAHAFAPMVKNGKKDVRVVLEGGSIDVNGAGALLTTEECLLSSVQQRNPGVSREQMEKVFGDHLGIKRVIWLNQGIAGDDTHGHVDDLARFVAADTVVTVIESDRSDDNYLPLQENLDRLRSATDQDGRPLKVQTLPMPAPVVYQEQRLPASYVNFYIANGIVLVPTFNDPNDRVALNTLADIFPTRKIVGIHCGDFVWGLGTMHCMTQQQPAI
jgi:agmatine deiminase